MHLRNNTAFLPSLSAALIFALAALGATPAANAAPIDLNDLYADPSVVVSADGSMATISEDVANNPVLLSSFDYGTSTVLPGALFPIVNLNQQFNFSFNFVEPAGNDAEFFLKLLDDTGASLLTLFSTDTASVASVFVNLNGFIGQTIGIEFGLASSDATFDSFVEISGAELTEGTVVAVPEPATAMMLLLGIGALLWLRTRPVRVARVT